ncbi:MAG: arginase family protein [Bacteroidales bacterium]|nr:arginase family protein [Bacteroidales bacterium]
MINDILDFLEPVNTSDFDMSDMSNQKDLMFANTFFQKKSEPFNSEKTFDIAIVGIPEERNSKNKGTAKAPDKIRSELYRLYSPTKIKIVDFGNIKKGKTIKDTYIALTEIVYELLKNELTVITIGGSKDLIIPVCKSYEKGKKQFNLCVCEPKFNLNENKDIFSDETYLSEIINNNKKLFNYTNLGYQTYYNPVENINFIQQSFEAVRLGISRSKLYQNEPFIRDADFFAIDINSVKKTDAPGTIKPSIHGFYGEEACQLAKYAGISDKISTFGIFNVNPNLDNNNQTSELSAQIIWHFIQAFYSRKNEFPESVIRKMRKYIVNVDGIDEKIIFYKSSKTGRWWIDVSYKKKKKKLISCTFDDYIKASGNEIPERWWFFFQKLN